jgi:predicted amidohydrolase
MQYLDIYFLQTNLIWESSNANLNRLNWLIQQSSEGSLVVLPEMFATGFTMNPEEHAQTMDGEALDWMKLASANKMICGSLAIAENGKYYNRFLAVYNGEIVFQYNKKHLFSYGHENDHYTAGNDCGTFEFNGWQIAPFICYDLRFPEWIRNSAGADLMLFVANWPAARMKAWNTLLTARAIENQCYVLGVNRVGDDGNGIKHAGHSQLIDFSGEHRVEPIENREQLVHAVIEKSPMQQFRERFPFLKDRTL